MGTIETAFLSFISGLYEAIGWPGVVLLMALENTGVPLPSEPIMMFAGWILVHSRGLPVWWVLLAGALGAVGSLIGALFVYWISRRAGRLLLLRYGKYVLIFEEDVTRAEAWFQRHGNWAVFLGRLVPLVRTLVSVPAGIGRMNVWRFSLYTLAGSFLWNSALAYAGFALGENWERLRYYTSPFDVPILVVLSILVAWVVFRRLRNARARNRASRHSDSADGDEEQAENLGKFS